MIKCSGENEILRGRNITKGLQKDIKEYPNPTQGIINVELPTNGNWQITATDLEGRVVWQQSCTGCEGTILHRLEGSKGMYFIKIINTFTGEQTVKKIIVQ